ncbi:MAG: YraN family protein [Bacteroidaceae bacterium]|nr:YraN family protein [Bacteroidaceae bacterium]
MDQHNEFGRRGEDLATALLLSKGYSILDRNWRSGHKELDIVARDGADIVFVEVKTRKNEEITSAIEAVNRDKMMRIISAAEAYIKAHNYDLEPRFDIITLVGAEPNLQIEHLEDAFFVPLTKTRSRRSVK